MSKIRPCIFRPFNFQKHFLIKNLFLPQFSIQFNICISNVILNIEKQINYGNSIFKIKIENSIFNFQFFELKFI